jgi:diguanylate cyclase (GGDEF)-like protein
LPGRIRQWVRDFSGENPFAAGECARENVGRLRSAALVLLLINVVHVLWFGLRDATSVPQQERWRMGILLVHAVSGVLFAGLGLLARRSLRRPPNPLLDRSLVFAGTVGAALLAASLAIIDQWATPSITPFVIGTTAISTVFLNRPLHSFLLFGFLLAIGGIGMALTQPVPAILLSNQANMVAATFLATFLATLLWRKHTANLVLQRALRLNGENLEQKRAQLEALAQVDPLTGLYNRREFSRLAGRELVRAARQGAFTALVLVDVDHFKQVNDTYGHPVGDEVLKNIARVLLGGVRESDVVSRFGGDELMLLLPDTNENPAITLVNRLRQKLGQAPVFTNGQAIRVTVSFGIAVVAPGAKATLEQTYLAADELLYRAKSRGRDRVESTSLQHTSAAALDAISHPA